MYYQNSYTTNYAITRNSVYCFIMYNSRIISKYIERKASIAISKIRCASYLRLPQNDICVYI